MPIENPTYSDSSNQERKLAAILFADIVGYTALMQVDETKASTLLHRFQQEAELKVKAHNGRIVNFYGDGVLCIFNNPLEAMQCAIALQTGFKAPPSVPVRIGVHSGTVVFDNDKVYGDSVNISSRIESMGTSGAILFSKKIRDEIKNQPEIQSTSLGFFEFKNVLEPMEVFAVSNEGFPIPSKKELDSKFVVSSKNNKRRPAWQFAALAALAILLLTSIWQFSKQNAPTNNTALDNSIAVLPFKNFSTDQENQFFCLGVMDAILNNLSKIEGLTVISRSSVEQYQDHKKSSAEIAEELGVAHILEGSVQRSGDVVRISTQLIEANKNQQVWSQIFDRQLTDIFQIQSDIAEQIAGELEITLTPEAKARLNNAPTYDIAAYEYYLRGRENLVKLFFDRRDIYFENAQRNFKKAIELDSLMAPAYADLADSYRMSSKNNFTIDLLDYDTMKMLCEKALSINPNLPQAHLLLGEYYLQNNQEELFVKEQMKALEADENYARAYAALGAYYAAPGRGIKDYNKGIKMLNKAIQVDPISSQTIGYYDRLAFAYMHINAFEQAEFYAAKVREAGDFSDGNALVHLYLVQGKYEEAEVIANDWLARGPMALRYLTEIAVNYHKDYKGAIEMYKEFEKNFPDEINFRQRFGLAYIFDGQIEKGHDLLKLAMEEYQEETNRTGEYSNCYDQVGIYSTMGDIEKALELLRNNECGLGVGLDHYILIDPLFKNLWDNDEFQQIVAKRQAEKTEIREKIVVPPLKG